MIIITTQQPSQINMFWAFCNHSAKQTRTLHIGGSNLCVTDEEIIETWPSRLSVFP